MMQHLVITAKKNLNTYFLVVFFALSIQYSAVIPMRHPVNSSALAKIERNAFATQRNFDSVYGIMEL